MAYFKCSTLSHLTGDIEKTRVRNGQILIPNELNLNFWVAVYGAKFHQNLLRTATVGEVTDIQTYRRG